MTIADPSIETTRPMLRFLEVPEWLQKITGWAWRLAVIVLTLVLLGTMFMRLRVVMVPLLVALMLSSVLSPLVAKLVARRVPRLAATWMVLLGVGVAVGGTLVAIGWTLVGEVQAQRDRWELVGADVRRWLQQDPIGLSAENVAQLENTVRRSLLGGAGSLNLDRAQIALEIAGGFLLTLALTFFFVKDGGQMWNWILRRVAPLRRAGFDRAGRSAVEALSGYMRAVSLTGLIDALAIGIALAIIGVPLVIPLAIFTFFGAFLPVVGATVAGALAAVVALVVNGPGDAVLVVLVVLVIQQLEGDVLMPLIMGRSVALHPAVVLGALACGGALAGIIGALVAVPIAAMAMAGIGELRREYALEVSDGQSTGTASGIIIASEEL